MVRPSLFLLPPSINTNVPGVDLAIHSSPPLVLPSSPLLPPFVFLKLELESSPLLYHPPCLNLSSIPRLSPTVFIRSCRPSCGM